ncbi:MAG: CDP-glycerol glycerophosphotransferase family protein [Clostridia bacterium]
MEEETKQNAIIDIYWNRIFLNITFKIYEENIEKIYLVSSKEVYAIKLEKTNNSNEYLAKINITNIDGKMLENDNYEFKIKKQGEYEEITIAKSLAYKLEDLDKIFRYYRNIYAYTISFGVKKIDEQNLTCVIKSMYMKLNKDPRKRCVSNKSLKNAILDRMQCVMEFSLKGLYKLFDFLHPIKKNKILLMSETRKPIGGNLKALDERLKERKINENYKISYSFSTTLQENKIKTVFKWMALTWKMSKQEFIFIDDYTPILKFINLSKKTKLIQVWHAGVGFKAVGYARFGFGGPEPYRSCHRKYDYAIVGEESLIPVYEEVFGIKKEKILPYGLSRMDNFFDKESIQKIKEDLYKDFPYLKEKKVILFAPTFRAKTQANAYYPNEMIDLEKIYNLCKEQGYVFIIKMHPFVKEHIQIPQEYNKYIKDFSSYTDINDLFYITDILITDYSSSVYEFSKLNKPILLYTFDLDNYQLINKVHKNVKEYKFAKVCFNMDELIENIKNIQQHTQNEKEVKEHIKASDLIIDNIILGKKEC